jgi:hypothetical protein
VELWTLESQKKVLQCYSTETLKNQLCTTDIDGQMGWAKRAARGTARFGLAQARPDPHKDGSGRHGPLWRAMLGPLPRHVGRHGHGAFRWMARFGPLYLSLHIKISYVCDCLNILYLNIGQYMTTCKCVSLYVC